MFPSLEATQRVQRLSESFGNKILYDMCSTYPEHIDSEVVSGKLWLIGRAYSASLERKKPPGKSTGDLYRQVTKAIVESDIDKQITALKEKRIQHLMSTDDETISQILHLHNSFIRIVIRHVEIGKRSLASKYLHFHIPELIYIYDSIAAGKLQAIYPRLRIKHKFSSQFDYTYTKFFFKMLKLRDELISQHELLLTPRQIDRLLLQY